MGADSSGGDWQLEEDSASAYERYLVPRMFAPWAQRLVDRANVDVGDRVLDAACGTGIVARTALDRVGSEGAIAGLDVNPGMLTVARDAAPNDADIDWREGDVTDMPFDEGAFDVVLCQQALQFLSDPTSALTEMRRVLSEGGRLGLSVWRPLKCNRTYTEFADALEEHASAEAGTMMRSPFPSWTRDDLRSMIRKAGFDDVTITIDIGSMRYPSFEEMVRREAASSPLAGPLGSLDAEQRGALVQAVAQRLVDRGDDEGIIFPMEAHLVLGRAPTSRE